MKLIVGLGNPGEKYENTRHNFGFLVVDKFLKDSQSSANTVWSVNNKLKSDIALFDWQPKSGKAERVVLTKPRTYMNNSGMAVSLLSSYYKITPEDIWIVYDELDLPMGYLKIRLGGAAAGHHGVISVMEKLGTDKFWRFRMGIGQTAHHSGGLVGDQGKEHAIGRHRFSNVQDYVLGTFGRGERGKSRELIKKGSKALQLALEKGTEVAMNRFNTR